MVDLGKISGLGTKIPQVMWSGQKKKKWHNEKTIHFMKPLNLSVPYLPDAHSIYRNSLVLSVYIYLNIIAQRGCQYAKA